VAGRCTDFLVLPDGTIKHALSIIYPLRAIPGVDRFAVHQADDFSTTISIVWLRGSAVPDRAQIAGRIREVLGPRLAVTLKFVNALPVTASGKHRHVTSEVEVRGMGDSVRGAIVSAAEADVDSVGALRGGVAKAPEVERMDRAGV